MSDLEPSSLNRERKTDISPAGSQAHILQSVLDSMGDGVTIIDRQGRFVLRNRAAEQIAGIAPKHSTPMDWVRDLGVRLPGGVASFPEEALPVLRALRGESVDSVELFVRHPYAPQGRWVSVTARPFADEQGNPNGAIAIYRDVTERKRAEQALRASEGRYRLLFEKNLAGILRTALDGRVLECNEAFAKMLGYDSSQEVTSLNVQAFYCQPADRDAILGRLRERQALAQEEICFRRKDGAPAWILTNLNLVEDDAGAATIIGTSFDITERKRSREALKQSQQRFAAFMRHLPGVAFMKNREGQYVFYNEAAQGLFQLDPQDFLGKTDHEVWPVEYADRFVSNDREVIRAKALVETVDPIPHKHAVHHWLIYRFPILDEHDEVQFIGGVGVDITERRQLEDQLRQSQKMEAIGRLAGGVAHDFNNLLTVISGYAHMIMRDLPHDDPLHSCVEEVLKAASRATSLTNQLLAFSRRQVIQPKVLDLNALVANMDRMLRRVIGEHIELETVLTPGIGDTGKGMDAEIMVHLFEPFYTSKETGKGTGLGLSTVYGIVKQSGGEIVVESEPGRGAIFNIYLPRITDLGERTPAAVGEHPVRAGTETILLVEDETGVRQLVREMLRRLGYKIHEASNGADAVRIFAQHQNAIDLLLTDVIMPQMSGRELAERLKVLQPSLKVLYISGYTDDMLAHHGVLESNVYLLQKPFAPDELAKKLREVLDAPTVRRAEG